MNITEKAQKIIDLLTNSGFEAYLVGGCVRDFVMEKPFNDIDITTSAKPDKTEDVLRGNNIKYVETGIKHGTITALLDGDSFEITTYRNDGKYDDNRHPSSVTFLTDIKEDLARRDFTMNAIAYNKKDGYVDPFNGKSDIENGVIRAVGEPKKRFEEDALRIMRAIRFASTLDFVIEENTKKAVFSCKNLLKQVSGERLFVELKKMLCGKNVFNVLMEYKEVIAVIIPELVPTFNCVQNNPWHIFDVYTHIAKSVEMCKNDETLRLVMLFHDIGKPQCKTTDENGIEHFYRHPKLSEKIAFDILKRFKASNDTLNRVTALVLAHDTHIHNNEKSIKKQLAKLGEQGTFDLIEIKRADMLSQNIIKTQTELDELNSTEILLKEIINRGDAFSVSDLAINGFDLINLGFKGKEIGEMLKLILQKVINNELENKKENLIFFCSQSL